VLSTDVLDDHVDDRAIARAIAASPDLAAAARAVVAAALDRGADDNLTLQIVRIDALPETGADLALNLARSPVAQVPEAADVFDGCRSLRKIHASDGGHVFLGAAQGRTRVTFKIPPSEHARDAACPRRFVPQEWIARRMSSAQVLNAAPAPARRSALYVITELADARTLRQWMIDRPQPTLDEVHGIIGQLVRGLRALHRAEMLHRHLRPENGMIDADRTAKLIELGSTSAAQSVPTDPCIYRLHEIVGVYGLAIKALIHEEFGDGIMSMIDFDMQVICVPGAKGDRVEIELSGNTAW
jgi:hypothetical protein